ncbi:hypothetical protein ABU614_03000 [Lysobacter firmicutimachus]|uniref:Uncharacterized protein n=1 Tax=Lysobacter firmicutimachus TaxID=1792846 RepID=A0AAU8MU11_9GAMM
MQAIYENEPIDGSAKERPEPVQAHFGGRSSTAPGSRMRAFVVGLSALLAGCPSGRIEAADRWHLLAAEAARLTSTFAGMAWGRRMLPVHDRFRSEVYRSCAAQAGQAGIARFRAVAVIDEAGTVKEYRVNPGTPDMACFPADGRPQISCAAERAVL